MANATRRTAPAADKATKPSDPATDVCIPPPPSIGLFFTLLIIGVCFGIAFDRNQLVYHFFVYSQMNFSSFIMLKTFLAACASSMLFLNILAQTRSFGPRVASLAQNFSSARIARGVPATLVGSALGGAGLFLAGSCPGTVYTQLGRYTGHASPVFCGCLAGAALYALADSLLGNTVANFETCKPLGQKAQYISDLLAMSRDRTATVLIIALVFVSALLEYYVPWTSDLNRTGKEFNNMHFFPSYFPPQVSGLIIGLLQVPLVLFASSYLGNIGGYFTVLSLLTPAALRGSSRYLSVERRNYVQLFFAIGAALGANWSFNYRMMTLDGFDHHDFMFKNTVALMSDADARPQWIYFLGGVLLVFGGRLANGCPSGHGLSGFAFLSVYSVLAVCGMFGTGILLGHLIQF